MPPVFLEAQCRGNDLRDAPLRDDSGLSGQLRVGPELDGLTIRIRYHQS
jgi:hypothetical protein